MVLLEHEAVLWSSSDRRCWYYVWRLPQPWWATLVFAKPVPRAVLGLDGAGVCWLGSCVPGMGWVSAVGVTQHVHRNMLVALHELPPQVKEAQTAEPSGEATSWKFYTSSYGRGSRLLDFRAEVRRDRPWPMAWERSAAAAWQVYIDNFGEAETFLAHEVEALTGSESPSFTLAEAKCTR